MIVQATYFHLLSVIKRCRPGDRASLRAVWGELSDEGFARKRMEIEGVAFAVLVNDLPVVILGVEELGGDATLWAICTEGWEAHRKSVLAAVRKMVKACFGAGHTKVRAFVAEGFVSGENVMDWLGFDMIDVHPLGINGERFTEFGRTA